MKNYNKKIICIFIVLMVLVVCITVVNLIISISNFNNSSKINKDTKEISSNKEIILYNKNECDSIIDFSNINNLVKESDVIAIVRIDSQSGSNFNSLKNEYVPVYTTGKLQVEKLIYNDSNYKINEGESIEYVRLGGEVTYSEYLKGLRETEKKKIEYNVSQKTKMNSQQLANKIVKDVYVNDIDIEEKKEYLVFLKYSNDYKKFNILGFEYGLREYDSVNNRIKNNKNDKYENFQVVKEKICIVE